jgi:hypothetical protein
VRRNSAAMLAAAALCLSTASMLASAGAATVAQTARPISVDVHRIGRGQLSPRSAILIAGRVTPAGSLTAVTLQRRGADRTSWTNLASARVTATGGFTLTVRTGAAGRELYRVRGITSSGHLAAASPVLEETVTQVPRLGQVFDPATHGYGTVRPKVVDNEGDGTSYVYDIKWSSWGPGRAVGLGLAYDPPANGPFSESVLRPAVVVAFHLGMCAGHPSYNAVEWYFPHDHQTFSSTYYRNSCTGMFAG